MPEDCLLFRIRLNRKKLELSARESRVIEKEKVMETDEMREEYDFNNAKRGVLYGKVEKRKISDSSGIVPQTKGLAVCIKTFDSKSLIVRKIYDVTFLENNLIEVVDEEGETEVYPAELFLPLSLPSEVESVLEQIAA